MGNLCCLMFWQLYIETEADFFFICSGNPYFLIDIRKQWKITIEVILHWHNISVFFITCVYFNKKKLPYITKNNLLVLFFNNSKIKFEYTCTDKKNIIKGRKYIQYRKFTINILQLFPDLHIILSQKKMGRITKFHD